MRNTFKTFKACRLFDVHNLFEVHQKVNGFLKLFLLGRMTLISNDLQKWRKEAYGSQDALAAVLGRDQNAVSRYERGVSPIPEDIAERLRELGYKGPLEVAKPLQKLGEIDFTTLHKQAETIVAEIEASVKKSMPATIRAELVSLAGEEIQDAYRAGRPEVARERIIRWWNLVRGTR